MSILHVPFEARKWGLPDGFDAWRLELEPDDIEALAGPEWRDLRLIIVAARPLSADSPVRAGGPREVVLEGSPLDIFHVEARLEGHPGVLEWGWQAVRGERLDLLHLEGMPAKDIERLLRARRVVVPKIGRTGRPRGTTVYTEVEFEAKVGHLSATRRGWGGITQRRIAEDMDISITTLQSCLTRVGVTWAQVQRREWPKD